MDLFTLVHTTEGYNGADLEAIVKDAIERCFIEGKEELSTEDLVKSQQSIKSISTTLQKRITDIKNAVKDMDLKSASVKSGDENISMSNNKSTIFTIDNTNNKFLKLRYFL